MEERILTVKDIELLRSIVYLGGTIGPTATVLIVITLRNGASYEKCLATFSDKLNLRKSQR